VRALPVIIAVALCAAAPAAQSSRNIGAPETFFADAKVATAAGAGAANVQIVIQRYSPDADRNAVETALKTGGYAAFVAALRKAPEVGHIEFGTEKFPVRYARQTDTPKGRTIVVVTDKPVLFLGGAAPDAKPREGYEVAIVRLEMHAAGMGTGVMAAAAKVRPDPEGGVQLDDYADAPIKLSMVRRKIGEGSRMP
jgi:hypothetical protein